MKMPPQGSFRGSSGLLSLLAGVLLTLDASGSGLVTHCTQSELETALLGGGTVAFACSGTITLTNTLTISQDTSLDAKGQTVTISGGNAVRIFYVNTNVIFRVRGLTLADGQFLPTYPTNWPMVTCRGQAVYGCGLLNQGGVVTLDGCTITNCLAQGGQGSFAAGGDGFGAALCNLGGQLQVTNCLLTGNAVLAGYDRNGNAFSGSGLGGAIYSDGGQVQLQSVMVLTNRAVGGTTGDFGGDGLGGAVYVTNTALFVSSSLFASNAALGIGYSYRGSLGLALGGAVCLVGGSTGMVFNTTFANNSVRGADAYRLQAACGRGGAVYNAGSLQVRDSAFLGNRSEGGFGLNYGSFSVAGQGGGVHSLGALVLNGCLFSANQAIGGRDYEVGSPEPGRGQGGAVWSQGGLAATNCTLVGNQAIGGRRTYSAPPNSYASGYGGAIFVTNGAVFLASLTLASNRADGLERSGTILELVTRSSGAGLLNTNGQIVLRNSILANYPGGGNVFGTIEDAGCNLSSDETAHFTAPGSLNQVDPLLCGVADNGGPTLTMGLRPGSPARDAISSSFPPVDQRGVARPAGPAADIGAFEADYIPLAVPPQLSIHTSSSNCVICFAAEARTYRLLASSNLVSWSSQATNVVSTPGPSSFFVPPAPRAEHFFRVVTP